MARLTDAQKQILYDYKDDLKNNNLDNFVTMVMKKYDYHGRPYDEDLDTIIAYMLEHNIPILKKFTSVGIQHYDLPTLRVLPNIEELTVTYSNGLKELIIMSPNLYFLDVVSNPNLEVIDLKYIYDFCGEDNTIAFNKKLKKIIVREDFGYISGIPLNSNAIVYCRKDSILGKYLSSHNLYHPNVNISEEQDEWYKEHTKFI